QRVPYPLIGPVTPARSLGFTRSGAATPGRRGARGHHLCTGPHGAMVTPVDPQRETREGTHDLSDFDRPGPPVRTARENRTTPGGTAGVARRSHVSDYDATQDEQSNEAAAENDRSARPRRSRRATRPTMTPDRPTLDVLAELGLT